jgi:hypothetical protein
MEYGLLKRVLVTELVLDVLEENNLFYRYLSRRRVVSVKYVKYATQSAIMTAWLGNASEIHGALRCQVAS